MARLENICKYIHLPAQSGNSRILDRMNRGYTRDWYLEKIGKIRAVLGDACGISSDMITGFSSETEEEHRDTLSLMDSVEFDFSYMFIYSERPGTPAAKKFADDIPLAVKKKRLDEIIRKQNELSLKRNLRDIGLVHKVLIEGHSKRSPDYLQGRNSANKVVIFPGENKIKGEYVCVRVDDCTGATLLGKIVA
jgi:tRNA-2-methylthio-N6-dimethylallyladenosine synthase